MLNTKVFWNTTNLRRWLKNPERLVPGNKCTLKPVFEDSVAYDLCLFLKEMTILNYNDLRSMKVALPITHDYDFSRQREQDYLK